MEKLHETHNNLDGELNNIDSDSESWLSEGEILFGFLHPHATSAGQHSLAAE
jgi:hypothetical protein